jgi:toxin ParE1/3/4
MATVFIRERAREDLLAHFVYLAENAPGDVADRFLQSAQVSFDELASNPQMGSPIELSTPELGRMRKWRVRGFENHLVFYEPCEDGVSIVRVLHAASDWWALLGLNA